MHKYFINLKVLILILLSQVGVAGYAQDAGIYPNKSITFIASSAPGGTTDFTARVLAQSLGLALGQTIVVENKAGASGAIAAAAVKKGAVAAGKPVKEDPKQAAAAKKNIKVDPKKIIPGKKGKKDDDDVGVY